MSRPTTTRCVFTRKGFWTAGIAAGAVLLLAVPTITRQGVNYQVTKKRIPLAFKATHFLLRDLEYRRLSAEITRPARSSEEKALLLLRWTRSHVRPNPPGLPVIDDHVASIIHRGYGEQDQLADVFTTLAAYSGLPAFWKIVETPQHPRGLVLSFLKIENRWTIWDAAAGKRYDPGLLSPEQLSVPEVLRPYKQMPASRLMIELRQRTRRGNPA